MTTYPTDRQLFGVIEAKSDHAKVCPGRTWFDLSHYQITVRCNCGWECRIEVVEEGNDE